jgi:hypothetical protein
MAGNIDLAAMTWSPKLLKNCALRRYYSYYSDEIMKKRQEKGLVLAKLFFNISEKCTD